MAKIGYSVQGLVAKVVMYLTVTINLVLGEMHVHVHVVNVKKCAVMFSLGRCAPLYLHKDTTTSCIEQCGKHDMDGVHLEVVQCHHQKVPWSIVPFPIKYMVHVLGMHDYCSQNI